MLARFAQGKTLSPMGRAFVLCGLLGLGCAATQLGATPADLAKANEKAKPGAAIYVAECASCHGDRGQGRGGVPTILGPTGLPELPRNTAGASDPSVTDPQLVQMEAQTRPAGAASRDPFNTAQDVFAFVSARMPRGRGGQLSSSDYWAVVNFLFTANGVTLPAEGVTPANARTIVIPRH